MILYYEIAVFLVILYYDYKYYEIPRIMYVFLLPLCKISYTCIAIYIIACIFYKYFEKYVGGADIKIILLLATYTPVILLFKLLLYASILGIIVCLLYKVKKVPFLTLFSFVYISSKVLGVIYAN